ncbi:MAG: translation elongation factor Ts [Planctomycetaceae bacterium]|nr:translation elongation factor Ts [Planctomycetaceae bacterium]
MAEITAAAVKALREITDLPMMTCKKALVQAEGDQDKAIEILREEVGKVREKRADNVTNEGFIFSKVSDDGSAAVLVEVLCESAPVATGQDLAQFGAQLTEQLMTGPGAATAEELLAQPAPGTDQTLQQIFDTIVNKIREKIVVARITKQEGPVAAYVHHNGKVAVLFKASGEKPNFDLMRDVAMHIAAMQPTVCNESDVDPALVKEQRDQLTAEAKASGKPDNIIDKIVDGRLKNFYVEQGVLVAQAFAKDDSKTVSQALAEGGLTADSFTLWVLGS